MELVPVNAVYVADNRQRRVFDQKKLEELAASIAQRGLLHPIVVEPEADGRFRLLAGERRWRAVQLLNMEPFDHHDRPVPPGQIPVTFKSNLTPLEREEVELAENVVRVDLDWKEKAEALQRLHALRLAQTSGEQTVAATASEVLGKPAAGDQITRISETLLVARHLSDPDVAKAKDQKEALKILRKKAEIAHRIEVAATLPSLPSLHTLLEGEVEQHLPALPSNTFSVILTDPPYGIDADKFGEQATTQHKYADSEEYALFLYDLLATQGFRVTLPQAHCYAFCDLRLFGRISALFTLAGWQVWPHPLFLLKRTGMLPFPDFGPRRQYETILFANKGKKPVLEVGRPDWLGPFDLPDERVHAAEKPVDAYLDLLRRSARPGEQVLDAFAGRGTIFSAASKLHLRATGIENDPVQIANCKLSIANPVPDALDRELESRLAAPAPAPVAKDPLSELFASTPAAPF